MSVKKFVGWRRVSTAKQRGSHLGLEAQKSIIDFFVEKEKGELIADYEECHSGTDLAGCTELKKAKEHCKRTGATLIIAKTDRCRDTIEALQLYEEMNGCIYFCDLPHTDKFTLTLFFSLAEREAMIVSLRTKQALAALKARGEVKLGAASEKYRETYDSKSDKEKVCIAKKRGKTKTERFFQSKDVQAFIRALRNVFAEHTNGEPREWNWKDINTCGDSKCKLVSLMKDYHSFDNELFRKWNFDAEPRKLQARLSSYIQTLRESILKNERFNKQNNE